MEPLTLPGTLDSLDSLLDYALAAAGEAGLDKKASYQLRLALDEIATNIVLHGYAESGRDGDVTIRAEITDEALVVTLEDTAVQYDPLQRGAPSEEELNMPIGDRPIGGLGVFLAIQGVSEFRYEWDDPYNRNIFVVNRTPEPASPTS
jgi:anti-sigma regulatory factor (Ser/Thr protein kinase)